AVGAEMDDGVGLLLFAQPQISGHIGVVQRDLGIVIELAVILTRLAALGLGQNRQPAQLQARDDKARLALMFTHPVALSRWTKEAIDFILHRLRQSGEPALIVAQR